MTTNHKGGYVSLAPIHFCAAWITLGPILPPLKLQLVPLLCPYDMYLLPRPFDSINLITAKCKVAEDKCCPLNNENEM